jgi:hypothetical protein
MKTKNWLGKIFDWKVLAILLLFALVGFNFYKDRKRKK